MPAARNRIAVTPSETVSRLLAELSRLTGQGPATLVREMLDEAIPALEMTVTALRDMRKRPEEVQAAVMRLASQAHQTIAQATLDLDTALKKKPGRKPSKAPTKGRAASKDKRRRGAAKPR